MMFILGAVSTVWVLGSLFHGIVLAANRGGIRAAPIVIFWPLYYVVWWIMAWMDRR